MVWPPLVRHPIPSYIYARRRLRSALATIPQTMSLIGVALAA
jgi:hypothetical protein